MTGNLLICTVGLPRSGKTTWAHAQGVPIVSPDAIRLASHGQRFWAPGEKRVWADAWHMARCLFLAGHRRVIVDATNTTRKRRDFWREDFGDPAQVAWETAFRVFDASPLVCKQRATDTAQPDLHAVIDRMSEKWEPLGDDEKQIGALGSMTETPLNETDEGDLGMAIGTDKGNVVINFGKPVAWLGMPRDQAIDMATAIYAHAIKIP